MSTKLENLPITGYHFIDGDRLRFAWYIIEFKQSYSSGDMKSANEVLEEIINYLVNDFKIEEKVMKKYQYPGLGDHLRDHANFFVSLRAAQALGAREAVEFIERWFIIHTMKFDIDLGRFMKEEVGQFKS